MAEDDDDREWPHRDTVYVPLADVDPALAARLLEEFGQVVRDGLTAAERQYVDSCAAPRLDAGTEPGGDRLVRISFFGTVTMMDWDGTVEDAVRIVRSVASNASYNASHDYWISEGWRTRTTSTGGDDADR